MRLRLAICLTILAAALPAQVTILPIDPVVPRDGALKAYLGLTDAQLDQLRLIQKNRSDAVAAVYRQINEKQQALDALLRAGSRDAARLGQLMIEMADLRKQLPGNGGAYRESALAVLTPDQKAKLPALSTALQQAEIAHQAVGYDLIDGPPVRTLPARVSSSMAAGVAEGPVTRLLP